ncbi:MAG: DUF349 domain-containing protein [Acidobacteria bacterium]|nr:DUF349 domain-containing protein [Acidobacteriota bacterium]
MGILEKLRPQPRWKHADPAVRAAAAYDLGPDESDTLHALAREDTDPKVRRAAVTCIDAVDVLGDIGRTDPDEDVRSEAMRSLAGIAAETMEVALAVDAARHLLALGRSKEIVLVVRDSASGDVRASVVDLVDDERSLGAICRQAQDGAIRLRALARMRDEDEVFNVALKAEQTDVAVAALERITTTEQLTTLGQRARSKVAGRRARVRLRAAEEAAVPAATGADALMSAEDRQRARDVLERAEALVAVADLDEADQGLAAVRLAWAELQADVELDGPLTEQFESAAEAAREAIAERREERTAELARADAIAREQSDRNEICEVIASLDGPGAADRLAELQVRWDSLPPIPSEYAASLTRRFQSACRAFHDRESRRALAAAAAGRLETLATELEQLLGSGQAPHEVVARWRGLRRDADVLREHASANPAAAERLERGVAALEALEDQQVAVRAAEERDNLRRLDQLCRHTETLVAADAITLKVVDRALRDIQVALGERAPLPSKKDQQDIQRRLESARAALGPRAQSLRDADEWQRWANLQVQERLAGEMEALKAEEDLEAATRGMRDLQARWKKVALAPRVQGEAMWRRFKAAQDEVFTRTAAHVAAQNEARAGNLAHKQALCERAEALASSSDWVRTAQALQELQTEWKAIGPVSRGREKAIWERFRAACNTFFKRRQTDLRQRRETWAANMTLKVALCERAEAVVDSTDWNTTAGQLRQMQVEWKGIGPVKKSQSEAVLKRFRTACDRFFERYKHRDEVDLASKAAPREAVIGQLESLVPAESTEAQEAPEGLMATIDAARAAWLQAPDLPRLAREELTRRYQHVLGQLVAAWPGAFSGTDLDPEVTRQRMEKLIEKVEAMAPGVEQRAAPLSPTERLAQQLREALAANTITGGQGAASDEVRRREAEQELRRVQAQWARFGPVPVEIARVLNDRLQRACGRVFQK